jgi:DUF4097 and DUF4098 domain-containing protein YvlB
MKRLNKALACVAMVAGAHIATAQDTGERVTASFSDPSHPGVLHVSLVAGSITVKGGPGKDVIIQSRGRDYRSGDAAEAHKGGLRRLSQQPSLSVEEQNNRMKIESPSATRPVDLEIQVPARTHLDLETVNSGDIKVEGVEGEIEVGNVNGSITLAAVSGSIVAHTVNGKVSAAVLRVTPEKPMAFTSLNGAVDITLPAAVKANLKLRSDNGEVFTDFDLKAMAQSAATVEDSRQSGGRYRIEVNKVISGSVNGGGPDFDIRTFNGNIYVRKGS